METYDVILIGTGAGGGTLARHLAPSGKRILLLERGDWLPREPQNWLSQNVFVENRYVSEDTWYDEKGKPFQPQIHYFVGGATKLYGAALYRLRAEDFGELAHHDGLSPAWPISYDELEPYYTQAEQLYQVHGARGEDPTEPPASAPYPHPAVSHEPRIQQLSDELAAAGYHPFHAPCGILLDEANMAYSTCVRCANCDGFPCPVHAKADAEVLGVRPALEHGNVTLLRNAKAVRLETNETGTAVTEVVVDHEARDGDLRWRSRRGRAAAPRTRPGCCFSRRATSIRTGSPTAPTRSGATSCSTTAWPCSRSHVRKTRRSTRRHSGSTTSTSAATTSSTRSGNIQMVGKSQAPMFHGEKPGETKLAPEWTLERVARHAIDFWLSTEDLPQPENRVSVDRDGKLTLSYSETNAEAKKQLYEKLRSLLGQLDLNPGHLFHRFAYMKNEIPVAGCAHQAGTCRFGADPATSALNSDCRAHEVDNLYVVDTSVFPSIGAVNPALTAMANSLRVGDHLLERLGA